MLALKEEKTFKEVGCDVHVPLVTSCQDLIFNYQRNRQKAQGVKFAASTSLYLLIAFSKLMTFLFYKLGDLFLICNTMFWIIYRSTILNYNFSKVLGR